VTLNVAETSVVKSQVLVLHGAIFLFYSLFKDVIHLKTTSYWFTQYPCGRPISAVPPSLQVAFTTLATVSLNCECVIYDLHLTKFRLTTILNVYVKDHSCGTVIIW